MAFPIHDIIVPERAITADGDQSFDLPVNPLSVLLLHISPLNDTGTIGEQQFLEGLLSAIDNVRILHLGAGVVTASGVDLAVLALLYHRIGLWQSNLVETDDSRRSLVLPILFGRKAYDVNECFPAVRRGEMVATITFDIADTGFNGLRFGMEAITLPGANPRLVQKVTTVAQTFAATGQNDIDLPLGNLVRAILMFGTTGFAGATPVPSLSRMEVMLSDSQVWYSGTNWAVLRAVMGLTGLSFPPDGRHIHSVNAAGAGREDTETAEVGASIDDNYALLHFDPLGDDSMSIDTAGASRFHVRVEADTADAVRALPVEMVKPERFKGTL